MSVIIKDMEMPRSCGDCNLIMGCPVWKKKWIRYEDRLWYMENRDVCCPLEEVIQCRDCIYSMDTSKKCPTWENIGDPNGYCSLAKRRTDGSWN